MGKVYMGRVGGASDAEGRQILQQLLGVTPAGLQVALDVLFDELESRFPQLAGRAPDHRPRILSADEMAHELGISRATLDRWADAGRIPCMRGAGGRKGGRRLFDPDAVKAALATREEGRP